MFVVGARFSVLISALVATLSLAVAPAHATFPGKNGKIAFETNVPSSDVKTINPDGSGETVLIPNARNPSWSPDGAKIAYVNIDLSQDEAGINYANADGTAPHLVSDRITGYGLPFSPDGGKLAFPDIGGTEIHTINLDGSGEFPVVQTSETNSEDVWPDDWSVTDKILLGGGNPCSLYSVNPDGSALANLLPGQCAAVGASWSPDGSKVAFSAGGPPPAPRSSNFEVFVANANGSDQENLTNTLFREEFNPVWSPDGTMIAFSVPSGDEHGLYVMNADGTGVTKLTNTAGIFLNWQPIPGPRRSDYKNAAKFCKAEQAFWGDQFAQRYGGAANAYGKCVSQN